MAVTVSARSRFNGPSTPALIRGAGLCATLGIGLSITEYADLGKWITVAGVVLLIWSLHRYGRSGPDAPIVFELAPPRKTKKKRRRAAAPLESTPSAGEDAPAHEPRQTSETPEPSDEP